jgi:hypothetical protein
MKDPIDTAIDQVTARMVQVREDEDLALRIAAALPARSTRFSWLIPQFAAIAAFAIAAVVWTMREPAPTSLLPSSDVVAVIAVPNTVVAREPGTALRTQPLESAFARHNSGELRRDGLENLESVEPVDGPDFERSLAPIAAMSALVMRDMEPGALPGAPALTLAPIEIADLPMTAESFSPR